MRNKILFAVLVCLPFLGLAQDRNEIIQQRIEFISEQNESEEIDLTNIFEQLNYYFDRHINLNDTDAGELRYLNLLTEVQITNLLLHREQFGKLISIYELQALQYWDLSTISLVLPFGIYTALWMPTEASTRNKAIIIGVFVSTKIRLG